MNKVKKSIVLTFTLPIARLFLCGGQSHITLFDGKNLDNWERTDFAGKGEVRIDENGSMVLEMGAELSGVHWKGKTELPKINY